MISKEQILQEESGARKLELPARQRTILTDQAVSYAEEFLDLLPHAKAFETEDTSADLEKLPFTGAGRSMSDLLAAIRRTVDYSGINPASHGHVGYIPGGGLYPSALADYLADVTNRYAGIYFANPGAVRMENFLIRWMCDLIGYPEIAHGNLASGGSIANLIGVTTARDSKNLKSRDVHKAVIYVNPQTHHCVHKAIRIAGLGEAQLREVQLDDHYRMSPSHLENCIADDLRAGRRPFMVIISLGSTDTGAVDPLDEIADITSKHDIWLQVDAAYGGFFILVDELKHHFKGVERSDSYIVDPHKGMFLPYGTGAILVRNVDAMQKSHYYQANYMQDAVNRSGQFSPADLSPELTKHFRGLRMWLPMQLYGLDPFVSALREKWLLTRYFYHEIAKRGFTVGPEPELSVAIYRYSEAGLDDTAFNKGLADAIREDGRMFISSTLIDGVFWLRLAVLCFRTHLEHIELLLELLTAHRDRLLEEGTFRL